ncbi:hypothetical protein ACQ4PT_036421 [Festuca glaucescens]
MAPKGNGAPKVNGAPKGNGAPKRHGSPLYPTGSPKYNLSKAKKPSPKADKRRASWNRGLEKALVELLQEHNNPYHRGQNGWSIETWNMMVKCFNSRHKHVQFTKSQIQDKEKDLKRDYRMLRDARKQSGVGWDEERCMIQADPHLWDNLEISFGKRIKKFRKNGYFPLYDLLGSLYESQIAEGNLNFTSMAEPSDRDEEEITTIESDGEHDDERELEKVVPVDEDFQILDQVVTSERDDSTSGVGVAKEKLKIPKKPKRSPKKPNQSSGDALVGVMKRFVDIKEKERNKDDTVEFSITRCMAELRNLEGVTVDFKVKCYGIFKCAKNCEIFINVVAANDGSALAWLKSEIGKPLPN